MAGVTSAVIGAAVAVKGSIDAKKGQRKAASDIAQANIQSAQQLEEAGRKAEADILREKARAAESIGVGAELAEAQIAPFVGPGTLAFEQIQAEILGGLPISGPLAESLKSASTEFVRSRPGLFDLSSPVIQGAVEQQGELSVSGAQPAFRQNLLTAAQQGIGATGDVAGIRQRGLESLADIAGATGAQRASALVGQAPQLAQLSAGAGQARLLGDVAGQRARTDITETLAGLAGRLS